MSKRALYILGLVTLFLFPAPSFLALYYFESIKPIDVLSFEDLTILKVGYGIELGVTYAFIALIFMRSKLFEGLPRSVEKLVKSMDLNIFDCIFFSLCAGIGEEILFRAGIQYYLGPILTSLLFIALHGYFSLRNIKTSLYGLLLLPFILLIGFGYYKFGLWFCIAAHFAYDFVLFVSISFEKEEEEFNNE